MHASIGITKWAGEQSVEICWGHRRDDSGTAGYRRADGWRAIATNGDLVFEDEDGFTEAWEAGEAGLTE